MPLRLRRSSTPFALPSPMTDIATERRGRAGLLVLDRPAALHAMTLEMIRALQAGLDAHRTDPAVEVIVIRSSTPTAFCAGGDMRRIHDVVRQGDFEAADRFFDEEYTLDRAIAACPKPVVALVDGIALGGGLGLAAHARHGVVTEQASLGVPETAIGFIPDVGASWYLARLEPPIGMWLALTGTRLAGPEAVAAGLATQLTPRAGLDALGNRLADPAAGTVEAVLAAAAQPVDTQGLLEGLRRRAQGFEGQTLAGVLEAWRSRAGEAALAAHSPRALDAAFKLLQAAAQPGATLEDCMAREIDAAHRAIRHADFAEGIRAVLVDKDRRPRWQS